MGAYSLALAQFRKEENDEKALDLLISAIIKFPGVIPILTEKLNIDIKAEDKGKLISLDDSEKCLQILYKLYAERSSVCWQGENILPFLYKATNRAIRILSQETTDHEDFKIECDSASLNRKKFKSLPENILRHLVISGYDSCINYVHLNFPGKKVLAYDPFPPKDEIISYEALSENWRDEVVGGRLRNSTFGNFMETMIRPNLTVRDMLERVRDETGGVETTAGGRIRQEFQAIYDMFREQIDEMVRNDENETRELENDKNEVQNREPNISSMPEFDDEELARRLQEEEWD